MKKVQKSFKKLLTFYFVKYIVILVRKKKMKEAIKMKEYLADLGDYDLVQVSENEFKKVYHKNAQGTEKTTFLTDKEVSTVKDLIVEIEETEDTDDRFEKIQYLEREYLK